MRQRRNVRDSSTATGSAGGQREGFGARGPMSARRSPRAEGSQLQGQKEDNKPKKLDPRMRAMGEKSMGASLAGVNIHDGPKAKEENRRNNSEAYAEGQDIYLGEDVANEPNETLAHELVHTVQQKGGSPRKAAKSKGGGGGSLEAQADTGAAAIMAGTSFDVGAGGNGRQYKKKGSGASQTSLLGADPMKKAEHLKLGSKGPRVAEWQSFLAAQGYTLPASETNPKKGKPTFGRKTAKATELYQASRGFNSYSAGKDGIVGENTRQKMLSDVHDTVWTNGVVAGLWAASLNDNDLKHTAFGRDFKRWYAATSPVTDKGNQAFLLKKSQSEEETLTDVAMGAFGNAKQKQSFKWLTEAVVELFAGYAVQKFDVLFRFGHYADSEWGLGAKVEDWTKLTKELEVHTRAGKKKFQHALDRDLVTSDRVALAGGAKEGQRQLVGALLGVKQSGAQSYLIGKADEQQTPDAKTLTKILFNVKVIEGDIKSTLGLLKKEGTKNKRVAQALQASRFAVVQAHLASFRKTATALKGTTGTKRGELWKKAAPDLKLYLSLQQYASKRLVEVLHLVRGAKLEEIHRQVNRLQTMLAVARVIKDVSFLPLQLVSRAAAGIVKFMLGRMGILNIVQKLGPLLDGLASPTATKVSAEITVPFGPLAVGELGLKLEFELHQSGPKLKIKGGTEFKVGAKFSNVDEKANQKDPQVRALAEKWKVSVGAFVGVKTEVEALGDDGKEAIGLAFLGIHTWLVDKDPALGILTTSRDMKKDNSGKRKQSQVEQLKAGMDDKDLAKASAAVAAGAHASVGDKATELAFEFSQGVELKKDKKGKVGTSSKKEGALAFKVKLGGLEFEVKYKADSDAFDTWWRNDMKNRKGEDEFEVTATGSTGLFETSASQSPNTDGVLEWNSTLSKKAAPWLIALAATTGRTIQGAAPGGKGKSATKPEYKALGGLFTALGEFIAHGIAGYMASRQLKWDRLQKKALMHNRNVPEAKGLKLGQSTTKLKFASKFQRKHMGGGKGSATTEFGLDLIGAWSATYGAAKFDFTAGVERTSNLAKVGWKDGKLIQPPKKKGKGGNKGVSKKIEKFKEATSTKKTGLGRYSPKGPF